MASEDKANTRLERQSAPTLQNWKEPSGKKGKTLKHDVSLDCGWGRLFFAHTFRKNEKLLALMQEERVDHRDIAFYVRDPHVLISLAPDALFLDPSHTYRMWLSRYQASQESSKSFFVRRVTKKTDLHDIERIYRERGSVPPTSEAVWKNRKSKKLIFLVVEEVSTGKVVGSVLGVDHVECFRDPEGGSSLWSLVVDTQAPLPGVGTVLVRYLCEYFLARGRNFMDLSVMHNNEGAIALYENLNFERIPVFCVKRKNSINEQLYTPRESHHHALNPYALIIVNEAKRRGIQVHVIDEELPLFELTFGGRSILCRESLSDYTNAISYYICDDKRLSRKILRAAGLTVPAQRDAASQEANEAFLRLHERVVVKPLNGEQGRGISVDIQNPEALRSAIKRARSVCEEVLLEEYVHGEDLRMVVINYELVAAAIRKPAEIVGDGTLTIKTLIQKQSRKRAAATGGESTIPLDSETERCIEQAGYTMSSVLPVNERVQVRKTANLHTGGTIHDVTDRVHPKLREAAEVAAKALRIPVTGLDFIVPDIESETYCIIEANERPGLENHAPQPTAERFVDMLFPETAMKREDPS
ncbi:N-acetylglutaminylglutamine synthetase [bacterium]|nr:N-acetylglutaminylglutamine synthetase [bacterium]